MFARRTLLWWLIPLAAYSAAKNWKTATIVDIKVGSYTRVFGSDGNVYSGRRRVWTYSIDDGERIYEAEYSRRNGILGTEVNGRIEKNRAYIKLENGKEATLVLVKTTRKPN